MGENAVLLRSEREDHTRLAELRHAKIARLAYYLWQIGGEQTGSGKVNWLVAEHIFGSAKFRTYAPTETRASAGADAGALRPLVSHV